MIRDATAADLPALVRLLGQLNETAWPSPTERHIAAFEAVSADPRQRLLVVEHDGVVVGTAVLVIRTESRAQRIAVRARRERCGG